MLKVYGLVAISFFCVSAMAKPWQDLHSLLPKGTQLSYIIVDTKQKVKVASFQEETLKTPASVQKLLTATVAKLYLGDHYAYQTEIKGHRRLIVNKTYNGDLSLHFTGDPTLTRMHIKKMLLALKRLGVNKIKGDFLLNDSHFNGYQWSDGQAWNDLGVCYTSPSNAIIINRNCVLGNLSSKKLNAKKATLYIPQYEPVDISSNVSIVSKKEREASFCTLEMVRQSQNKYHLLGCIETLKRPFPLAFSVNDPGDYAVSIIMDELKKVGIALTGKVNIDEKIKNNKKLETLVSHQSPLLNTLLSEMLKDSDNLIADSLFKTIGARYFDQPGNFRNGAKAMKAILKDNGIDLENAYIADGSGLSRHNLMSTQLLMSVMEFIYAEDKKLGLIDSFSISGVDGTLKYHKGVNSQLLKGKIIAKTGSLKGVANLVGLVKSKAGDKLFVLMINGYHPEEKSLEKIRARHQKAPVYMFEEAFFNRMVEPMTVNQ